MISNRPRGHRVAIVAAARPNFMKVGPVYKALASDAEVLLVHTGQHYDRRMSTAFFEDLRLPEPDVNLGVGSGSHAEQTAGVMVACERFLTEQPVDLVVVVGDVNSTIACAMAAVKLHIPVAHVEAGLRSRDWAMPEEINRILTDRISRLLFTTSADADANLRAEGVPDDWIHLVGNVMIDTLLENLDRAQSRGEHMRRSLGLESSGYGMLTLHRPSNVDETQDLQTTLAAVNEAVQGLPLVFPVHPRTAQRLKEHGVRVPAGVKLIEPLAYLDFIGLIAGSRIALTDSGGVQEETSVLGIPCVTMRDNTERPITCELGTNILAGRDAHGIQAAISIAMTRVLRPATIPMWDGQSASRIARRISAFLAVRDKRGSGG